MAAFTNKRHPPRPFECWRAFRSNPIFYFHAPEPQSRRSDAAQRQPNGSGKHANLPLCIGQSVAGTPSSAAASTSGKHANLPLCIGQSVAGTPSSAAASTPIASSAPAQLRSTQTPRAKGKRAGDEALAECAPKRRLPRSMCTTDITKALRHACDAVVAGDCRSFAELLQRCRAARRIGVAMVWDDGSTNFDPQRRRKGGVKTNAERERSPNAQPAFVLLRLNGSPPTTIGDSLHFEALLTAAKMTAPVRLASPVLSCVSNLDKALDLASSLGAAFTAEQSSLFALEMELLPILALMEETGLACAVNLLNDVRAGLLQEIAELNTRGCRISGVKFNLASNQQCADVLFEKLRLRPPPSLTKTATKKHLPVSAEVLEALNHPLARIILQSRKKSKMLGT
jgi:hypothetical protein